jgi:hypothetical protein
MEVECSTRLNPLHTRGTLGLRPNRNRIAVLIGKTMTAARRQRKNLLLQWALLAAAVVTGGLAAIPAIRAATTEQIVVDRNSGLAIIGFDPVAYFIDRAAVPGREQFEHAFAGAVWRFRNEGNRAAFAANPDVYLPRFGGYDPVGVGRGVAVPGDPRLWLIVGERLYFFHTPEARDLFSADAEAVVAAADSAWPAVRLTLSP